MSWFRTVIGGIFGFYIGGPIGLIAGIVFGRMLDKSSESNSNSRGKQQTFYYNPNARPSFEKRQGQQQVIYFVSVFSMLAKLCMADGSLNEKSKARVESFIKNNIKDPQSAIYAHKTFDEALKSSYSFESFARQFYQYFGRNAALVQTMVGILFEVSAADGSLSSNEEKMIYAAGIIFHYSKATLDSFKERYGFGSSNIDNSYALLGVNKNSTDSEIKKAYHKLSIEFHPDTVAAKGLPEEFTKYATKKFMAINEAYETIKKSRDIK